MVILDFANVFDTLKSPLVADREYLIFNKYGQKVSQPIYLDIISCDFKLSKYADDTTVFLN